MGTKQVGTNQLLAMSFFEGIGDEVLISVTVITIVMICLLLWSLVESGVFQSSPTHSFSQVNQLTSNVEHRTTQRRESNTSNVDERQAGEPEAQPPEEPDLVLPESKIDNDRPATEDIVRDDVSELDSGESATDVRQRRLDFFNRNCVEEMNGQVVHCDSQIPNGSATDVAEDALLEPEAPSGLIHIRLKYLDDTERLVESQHDQVVQEFKRTHFADDLASNKLVRLISNGYVLEDSRSLESYGLVNNSVIHVQIQANHMNSRRPVTETESELDIGQFLSPILGVALLCVWIMHFQYREYFNSTATLALLVLSALFLTVVWGQHGSRTFNTSVQ